MAEFILPLQHLPLLGTLWPGDRNALSPLAEYGTPQERDEIKESLAGLAVMEPHGAIDVRFHHVMSVLDDPERFVSLDIITSGDMKSLETYFSTDKVSVVSLISGESGEVQVRENTGLEDFFSSEDFDGIPNNELTPADVTMSHPEAWIAAAIFDGERRSAYAAVTLAGTGNELILEPLVHDPASIQRTFAFSELKPEDNFFINLLEGFGGMDRTDVDLVGIGGHLQSLQAKGIIQRSGSGHTITEQMLPMIRRTLISDRMTMVRTGWIDGTGRMVSESALCIRADGSLLWFIAADAHPDRILLKYLSADHEKTILTNVLGDPACSLSGITVPARTAHPPIRMFCPQCGAHLSAGKKFCSVCGAKT